MTRNILYTVGRAAMKSYARFMLDTNVIRLAKLPNGPKIIALNHPTTLDPFLVATYFTEPVYILVTESAFKAPLFGKCLRNIGHIPVKFGAGKEAFDAAYELLKAGKNVAIFPEGQLSPLQGGLARARTGAARLALSAGVPIIPVGIGIQPERIRFVETGITAGDGQDEVARLYARAPYAVTIGEALHMEGSVDDHVYVRVQSQRLMQQINQLHRSSMYRIESKTRRSLIHDTAEFPSV